MSRYLNGDEKIVLVGVTERQRRKLPDEIICIPKTESISDLAGLYSAADVLVNPTWQDNYPTVNMESISCGTPVVTYRTGGSMESVTHDTGYVVGQGDIRGVIDAVRHIEAEGKDSYMARCRQYAVRYFRKEDRYADYLRLYEKLRLI